MKGQKTGSDVIAVMFEREYLEEFLKSLNDADMRTEDGGYMSFDIVEWEETGDVTSHRAMFTCTLNYKKDGEDNGEG